MFALFLEDVELKSHLTGLTKYISFILMLFTDDMVILGNNIIFC